MRIGKLEELQKIHLQINDKVLLKNNDEVQAGEAMISQTIKKIMELCQIARREGLLALEEATQNIPLESEEEALKQLITLVVDGTDTDMICGIGWARYYAGLWQDYKALRYVIYLEGALSIQAGDNPRILEEKLKSMLPHNMYLHYSIEQNQRYLEKEKDTKNNLIKNLCKGERNWKHSEQGYYVSKLVDYVICDISDKELQRVLREVENTTLALAMKGMSGDARTHIFENLSERLGGLIAAKMTGMGPVRIVDVLEASQQVLAIIIRLIDNGEIVDRYAYLEPFLNVFSVDTKSERQKHNKINQLRKMVEEYEQGAELVRELEMIKN